MTILESDMQKAEAQRYAERAEQEALKDGLTSLYNRRAWDNLLMKEELRCSQYGYSAAVVVLDLDYLKVVNDKQGHIAGDNLLKSIAQCLQQVVTSKDIVARIGGDEFVVLLVETDDNQAKTLVDRLEQQLSSAKIEASVGYDVRHPTYGIIHAWNHADRKMYAHKMAKRRDTPDSIRRKPHEPDYFL
jgi:diguanylate cyclase (GGDEF)-like protein